MNGHLFLIILMILIILLFFYFIFFFLPSFYISDREMLRRLFEDSRAVPSIKLSDQDSSRFFRDFFGIVKRLLKIGSIFGLIN